MTQENKDLLLKDLCARLPYKVKISIPELWYNNKKRVETLNEIFKGDDDLYRVNSSGMLIRYIKPYLFPLSSMTDKQYDEFFNYYHNIEIEEIKASGDYLKAAYLSDSAKYEWLNRNKFDWGYLIEKGLAIDCTKLNIY